MFVYVCSVCMCMCECWTHTCVCSQMSRPGVDPCIFLDHSTALSLETGCLTEPRVQRLAGLTDQWVLGICLSSHHTWSYLLIMLSYRCLWPCLALHMRTRETNSGLHACTEGQLPTEQEGTCSIRSLLIILATLVCLPLMGDINTLPRWHLSNETLL